MKVISREEDVYIQSCRNCKSVLHYAQSDIYPMGSAIYLEREEEPYYASFPAIVCPVCHEILNTEAKYISLVRPNIKEV